MLSCRIAYWNVQGLVSKEPDVDAIIADNAIDILILTETWLRSPPSLRNVIFHSPITSSNYREGIVVVSRPELSATVLSNSSLHVSLLIGDVVIIAPYLPPSLSPLSFSNFFDDVANANLALPDLPTFLLGDLNVRLGRQSNDHFTGPSARVSILNSFLESSSWSLCRPDLGSWTSTGPSGGRGIPDHVLSSPHSPSRLTRYAIIDCISPALSDHNLLLLSVDCHPPTPVPPPPQRPRWNISRLQLASYRTQFCDILSDTRPSLLNDLAIIEQNQAALLPQALLDAHLAAIMSWLSSAMTASCGIRPAFSAAPPNPRLTARCIHFRTKLDESIALLHRLQADPHTSDFQVRLLQGTIKSYRHSLRTLVKQTAAHQWLSVADRMAHPSRGTCFLKYLGRLHARNSGSRSCSLNAGDIDQHSAYFESTFGGEPTGTVPSSDPPLLPRSSLTIPESLILDILTKLPTGKTPGEDQVYNEMLRVGASSVAAPLSRLFQLCSHTGCVPSRWKIAWIHPVHKKGSVLDIANYRPIALTSAVRRVFEKCLLPELELLDPSLNIAQAGFRRKQSVADHLTVYIELTKAHPLLFHAFLDIKAAYDTVDRRLLWYRLRSKPGVSQELITLLQALFDDNVSCLLINGHVGPPIPNRRGLLQGSSLSPILFNHFIDDLLHTLSSGPQVCTLSLFTNHLFFADDANIHASSADDLQALLASTEEWAVRNGIVFSPSKSAIVAPPTAPTFFIHHDPIPQLPSYRYLGMTVNCSGIDWRSSFNTRRTSALNLADWFCRQGMHLSGWRPHSNVVIYKSFIRPKLEFGLSISLLPSGVLSELQQCQNSILRKLLSCARSTSLCTMHSLVHIAPVSFRNQLLHARFQLSIPLKRSSLVRRFYDQSLLAHNGRSHLSLSRSSNPLLSLPPPVDLHLLASVLPHRQASIRALSGASLKHGHLLTPGESRCHPLLRATFLPRLVQGRLIHWLLGSYSRGDLCRCCRQPLNRTQAVLCSTHWDRLARAFPQPLPHTLTPLDYAFTQVSFRPTDWPSIILLYDTVLSIMSVCLGLQTA